MSKSTLHLNQSFNMLLERMKKVEKIEKLLKKGVSLYEVGKEGATLRKLLYSVNNSWYGSWYGDSHKLTNLLLEYCPEFNHREEFGNKVILNMMELCSLPFASNDINLSELHATFNKLMSREVKIEPQYKIHTLELPFELAEEAMLLHWFDDHTANMSEDDQKRFKEYRLLLLFTEQDANISEMGSIPL